MKSKFRTNCISNSAFILSLCAILLSFSIFAEKTVNPAFFGGNETAEIREASAFNRNAGFDETEGALPASSTTVIKDLTVIPLGTSFGIKLFTDGVIVASTQDVKTGTETLCPAKDAGIKAGDYILSANGTNVTTNSSLAQLISSCEGNEISLVVKRGEETFETTIQPVFSSGSYKAGMWIRDSAAGIGTLTFYCPETRMFAGLGHGICDIDTHSLMSMERGEPAEINLCGIIRGEAGKPGQLQGYFASDESIGELVANNETGVYGTLDNMPQGKSYEVASKEEVKNGTAYILASLDNGEPKTYEIAIKRIMSADTATKNMIIEVTDPELLKITGGIVQGMSGCPIIQNEKIVGAVTHVFTDDPTTGYGIFAETMLEEIVIYSMSNEIE